MDRKCMVEQDGPTLQKYPLAIVDPFEAAGRGTVSRTTEELDMLGSTVHRHLTP